MYAESFVANNATLANTRATKSFYYGYQVLQYGYRPQKHVYAALTLYENTFFFLKYTVIGLLRSFVLYRLNLQESRCVSSLCSFFFFSLAESRPLDYTGKDVSAIGKISLVMIDRDFAYKCKRICSEFRQKGRCQSDSKLQEKKITKSFL